MVIMDSSSKEELKIPLFGTDSNVRGCDEYKFNTAKSIFDRLVTEGTTVTAKVSDFSTTWKDKRRKSKLHQCPIRKDWPKVKSEISSDSV